MSLALLRGIHRGPVNSPHKWPVSQKMFPFDDVIMFGNFDRSPVGLGSLRMESTSVINFVNHLLKRIENRISNLDCALSTGVKLTPVWKPFELHFITTWRFITEALIDNVLRAYKVLLVF